MTTPDPRGGLLTQALHVSGDGLVPLESKERKNNDPKRTQQRQPVEGVISVEHLQKNISVLTTSIRMLMKHNYKAHHQ